MVRKFTRLEWVFARPSRGRRTISSSWRTLGMAVWEPPDAAEYSALSTFYATSDAGTTGEVRFRVAETGAVTPAIPVSGPTGPIRNEWLALPANSRATILAEVRRLTGNRGVRILQAKVSTGPRVLATPYGSGGARSRILVATAGSGQAVETPPVTGAPRWTGRYSDGNTSTLTYPTGLTAGNLLLLAAADTTRLGTPPTIPGFTQHYVNGAGYTTRLFTRPVDGTESGTISTSGWGGNIAWCMAEYANVASIHSTVAEVDGSSLITVDNLAGVPSDRAYALLYISGGHGDAAGTDYPQVLPPFYVKSSEGIRWSPGVSMGHRYMNPGQLLPVAAEQRTSVPRTTSNVGVHLALLGSVGSQYDELAHTGARSAITYVDGAGYNSSEGTSVITGNLATDFILQTVAINGEVGFGHQQGSAVAMLADTATLRRRAYTVYGTLHKDPVDNLRQEGLGWHAAVWRRYRGVDLVNPFREIRHSMGSGRYVGFPMVNVRAGDVVVAMVSHMVNNGINAAALPAGGYSAAVNQNQWPRASFSAHKFITADGTETPGELDIGVASSDAYRSIVCVLQGAPV